MKIINKTRKQVVAKKIYKQEQKNKRLTTTLTYKHTDLLETHTTQNQKGDKNNKECEHVQKKIQKQTNKQQKKKVTRKTGPALTRPPHTPSLKQHSLSVKLWRDAVEGMSLPSPPQCTA